VQKLKSAICDEHMGALESPDFVDEHLQQRSFADAGIMGEHEQSSSWGLSSAHDSLSARSATSGSHRASSRLSLPSLGSADESRIGAKVRPIGHHGTVAACRAATLLLSHFCGSIDYELTGSSTNHRASLVKLLCFGNSCSKTWKESNAGAANWNKNGMPLNCGRRWQQCVRAYFGHISSLHRLLTSNRAFCAFGFGQEREEDLLQDVMRLRTELARRSEAAEADPGKRLFADTMSEVSPNLNRSGRASRELPKITPVTVKELPPSG
jgi:hypothetical protein